MVIVAVRRSGQALRGRDLELEGCDAAARVLPGYQEAERAGMSRQAMNQLLRSLERLGYIARSDAPDGGRGRIIHLTRRGRAAYSRMIDILGDIEQEWAAGLGARNFAQLKKLLLSVWESPLIR